MSLEIQNLISAPIVLPAELSLPEEAKLVRLELLERSNFSVIATKEDATAVGEAARNIRTHAKAVREQGMSLRRPLVALQSRIKAIEDDYCGPLDERQSKLERLLTAFAQAEAARVAEEEKKRQVEIRRIEAERVAAEKKARQELERLERESLEAAENAKQSAQSTNLTTSEKFKAGMEEEKRREALEAAKVLADQAIEKARADSLASVTAVVTAPIAEHKVAGASIKRVVKWEVTDQYALFKARPHLFSVEVKKSAVNSTCFPNSFKASAESPDVTSVPGLKLWYENETVIRSR